MDNPFALFGLPEQFALESHTLTERYRHLAARFHPDRFAASSAFEQRQAVMMSAALNQAYQTLNHPIDRAAALLQRHGIDADAPEHTAFAPDFLMQQMQWREELAEARAAADAAALKQLADVLTHEQQQLHHALTQAFEQAQYDQAAQLVRQGRFLDKLARETAAALSETFVKP